MALPTKVAPSAATMDQFPQLFLQMIEEIKMHRMEMELLRLEISGMRKDITQLQTENSTIKPRSSVNVPLSPQSVKNHPGSSHAVFLKGSDTTAKPEWQKKQADRNPTGREANQPIEPKLGGFALPAKATEKPASGVESLTTGEVKCPSAQPVQQRENKGKKALSIEPHTAFELTEHQRGDKALRRFMKTKTGLFDAKSMSIREVEDQQILCFKKKAYIPARLRFKTIRYHKEQHADCEQDALAALKKHCIWLDMDMEFFNEGFVVPTALSILQQSTSLSRADKDQESARMMEKPKPVELAIPSPSKAAKRRVAL